MRPMTSQEQADMILGEHQGRLTLAPAADGGPPCLRSDDCDCQPCCDARWERDGQTVLASMVDAAKRDEREPRLAMRADAYPSFRKVFG